MKARHTAFALMLALVAPTASHAAPAPQALRQAAGYGLYHTTTPAALRWQPAAGSAEEACRLGRALPPPPATQAGTARLAPLFKERYFLKFFQGGKLPRLIGQQHGLPLAVVLESGVWRLDTLNRQLANPTLLSPAGERRYLLRVPLLIQPGASLVVDQGQELRLSQEHGSFLLNVGRLYVQQGAVLGWQEARAGLAPLPRPHAFRPFILGWGGSRNYLDQARLAGLGFAENLSEGLGLANGPEGLDDLPAGPPPEAWINRSELTGLYYGLRARAASQVQLCNSRIRQSEQVGIQLEGDVGQALLAGNLVSGTRRDNGITVNKGNQHTRILANRVEHNGKDGIAIEHASGAWVAGNSVEHNAGNGLTVGDSSAVVLIDNGLSRNRRHGVFVRSSQGVQLQGGAVSENGGVGVYAYATPPLAAGPHYPVSVAALTLADNQGGALGLGKPHALTLWRLTLRDRSRLRRPLFRGDLNAHEAAALRELIEHDRAILLAPLAAAPR